MEKSMFLYLLMVLFYYDFFTEMIDKMIQDSDKDKDGYVNYQEYKGVRRPDGV